MQRTDGHYHFEADSDNGQEDGQDDADKINIDENQMLDIAEYIFNTISQGLQYHGLTFHQTFGGDDMIHVLEEFEDEKNVEVMTADDFLTRCYEIGVPELDPIQIACLMRVLGKEQLSGAIRLNELE